jgi:putative ubiquitin-RnfH superfamily antitoxin RatB of RatAB toxin-antitoxin module
MQDLLHAWPVIIPARLALEVQVVLALPAIQQLIESLLPTHARVRENIMIMGLRHSVFLATIDA